MVAASVMPVVTWAVTLSCVDDDIDVTNTNDVLWALTRAQIPNRYRDHQTQLGGPLDPIIPKGQKGHSSRGISTRAGLRMDERISAGAESSPRRAPRCRGKVGKF